MKLNFKALGAVLIFALLSTQAWADSQEMRKEASHPDGNVGGVRSECLECTKNMPELTLDPTKAATTSQYGQELGNALPAAPTATGAPSTAK